MVVGFTISRGAAHRPIAPEMEKIMPVVQCSEANNCPNFISTTVFYSERSRWFVAQTKMLLLFAGSEQPAGVICREKKPNYA
jgi:hypothetical protein